MAILDPGITAPPISLLAPVESALALTDVSFSYGDHAALDKISLRIEPGEKVALLGANGSGKSTVLKLLNGLLHPTSGTFSVFGQALDERSLKNEKVAQQFRRRVGFVFQNSDAQLFSPTVRDEIAFGPLQMGLSRAEVEQRIADVAAMTEITRLLDRPPFHLSGGEKKKVALASVLIINPDVILLDEPTNGLDPRSQRWLVEMLVTLHRAGKTLVTATHDLEIVPEIADRVVVMDEEHRIAGVGPTDEILRNRDLLLLVNLIHEHSHWHGSICHSHPHSHSGEHDHDHGDG
jgi:cobalt/nickel transport system ATP-binding protein